MIVCIDSLHRFRKNWGSGPGDRRKDCLRRCRIHHLRQHEAGGGDDQGQNTFLVCSFLPNSPGIATVSAFMAEGIIRGRK